ncbi:Hypothetical_protein [Hexamita inflata]|uniref:Hypothetical_protein n=1 Tax=Hexamita inflata TaxID=28002 RepID=A0AA86NF53_9EUKA|nr:Hypothetical protein HINF_LOCUS5816 [Hexamita inflata]
MHHTQKFTRTGVVVCIQGNVVIENNFFRKYILWSFKLNHYNQITTQPCLQGRCQLAYKGVTDFNSLISKNVSKMYLWKMSNLNDLWSKNEVKNYGICHLIIREFCMMELPYK